MTLAAAILSAAAALVAAAALPAPAAGSDAKVSLDVRGASGAYHVEGAFSVEAPAEVAWGVVTDYDGISRFVSSVVHSRVLSRRPGVTVLEQVGNGRFLFVSRKVALKLAVTETPRTRVEFREIEGSFAQYEGSWQILPSQDGCLVGYELTARPGPGLAPRFVARAALRRGAEELLDQVRREILRRATGGAAR